jgi:3-oxoacyl-[acyl-carrier-protein] synthase III
VNPSSVGIRDIAAYVPAGRIEAAELGTRFSASPEFLRDKTGCLSLARRAEGEDTSDLAAASLERLFDTHPQLRSALKLLVVVTQTPDGRGLPHVSGKLHGRFELPSDVAAFDISLGCSGWVYGLAVATALMEANGLDDGVLVTADPYSKILEPNDRDTNLLFGDAATATWLTRERPRWRPGKFVLQSHGQGWKELAVDPGSGHLRMNGRAVFMFSAKIAPECIREALRRNETALEDVDHVLVHQGSKYIVDTIGERLGVPQKTPFLAAEVGNTVSSSIPLMLASGRFDADRLLAVAGFGVGLSCAATILAGNET